MLQIVYFDEKNPYWDKDPKVTESIIMARITIIHDDLRFNGHLYISDICKLLGGELEEGEFNSRIDARDGVRFLYQRMDNNRFKVLVLY